MSYYAGDYYQGDYYQGDPFLGALIGMGASWLGRKLLGRGAKKAGAAVVAGTGLGALTGGAAGVVGGMTIPTIVGGGVDLFRKMRGRGAPANLTPGEPMFSTTAYGTACCPSGYHMTKDGSGRCVRNRSMNVANPRALRRSLRRVSGFAKLAKRSRTAIKKAAREV